MMGQITKEFAENLLERTEAGKHVNTTVWEEQQLVNAWLALHGYKTWQGMPQVCTRNSCSGPNSQPEIDEHALWTMVRVYHCYESDAQMVELLGYSLEMHVAKMRQALQTAGITPATNVRGTDG